MHPARDLKSLLSQPGSEAPLIIETEINPFHCLYQDALYFHTQSYLALTRSASEASRLSRSTVLLYLSSLEALFHQAIVELGRPDISGLLADPRRPIPLSEAWRYLPSVVVGANGNRQDPDHPPWPQLVELLTLRELWAYPGPASRRKAYYRAVDSGFDPLEPHQITPDLGLTAENLQLPRTGLPRDPYSLKPRHLDTVRGIVDASITAMDRLVGGALVRDNRHRREVTQVISTRPATLLPEPSQY